jgi:uncharacterized membrane protein
MFEKLLKYPIEIFHKGDFHFGIRLPGLILLLIIIALSAASIWAYRTTIRRTNRRFRGFLIALRTASLVGLAFCLLKPFITIYQTRPDDSYLLLLIDQSRSMQIADSARQETRLASVNRLLFDPDQGLIHKLNGKFKTRTFAFSDTAKRISPAPLAEANGERTNIPAALNEALESLQGAPLSGIVLLTDGADGSGEDITKLGYRMRDRKTPVHTVGVGSEKGINDIEVVKIDAPRAAEEDFPVEIWVTVSRKGYDKREVTLNLRDENRVVKTLTVNLDKDSPTRRAPIQFIPRNPGTRKYIVEVPPEKDEAVPQNNARKFLLKVAPSKRVKILYVEGRPRHELAFIKRALKNDPNIQITDRYLTSNQQHFGGTKSATDHDFGLYPDSKEALFDFDAIIFGNIAASAFSKQQLENTAEFVRTRGGGFLMLGGTNSLSNYNAVDSYIHTPIAEILPVEIELGMPPVPSSFSSDEFSAPPLRDAAPNERGFQLQLTPEGKVDPLMALAEEARDSLARWRQLPTLIGYSKVKRARAGATVLAVHPTERNEFGNRILIATHNYNAGRVMVFTPHSSWRWKMLMSKDDDSHERFWRQVAKWLTTAPKDRLKLDIAKTSYALKEPVVIEATAYDRNFELTNRAKIRAIITDENGKRQEVNLEQTLGRDGQYSARFIPPRRGEYRVDLVGVLGSESLGEQHGLFEAAKSYAEFTDAALNVQLLKTLANASGGEYYTLENAERMVNQISLVESAASRLVEEDIWDMPLVFAGVILLFGLEWFLRKRRGLA